MAGEMNFPKLLASMKPELLPGIFVFATIPDAHPIEDQLKPVMMFREAESRTLSIEQANAARFHLKAIFPCWMITLQIHSSLEAVGFLAVFTTRLAASGIGVNPVSAFHHDHLFVSVEHADQVMSILQELETEHAR